MILSQAFLHLLWKADEENRTLAFEEANRNMDYWNPYLSTYASSEQRQERAKALRENSK